ncbi:hypothetical protein PtB15_15B179 [Puccinia triticina]|nr:hypothetical protein PtB15_15B179 [Puccinia triticina]
MPARKTLFTFVLVVSALAGHAAAAPSSLALASASAADSTTAPSDNNHGAAEHRRRSAVNQLACDGTPAPTQPTKRSAVTQLACDGTTAPTQPTKRSAVNQLACDGTPAPTQPTKRSAVTQLACDGTPAPTQPTKRSAVTQLACDGTPAPTQPTKRSAVTQLACDGTPAPTQPTKRSAVNQLACDVYVFKSSASYSSNALNSSSCNAGRLSNSTDASKLAKPHIKLGLPGAFPDNSYSANCVETSSQALLDHVMAPSKGGKDKAGYGASFVSDLNLPNDTCVSAGARFKKIWMGCNTGSVFWPARRNPDRLERRLPPFLARVVRGPCCALRRDRQIVRRDHGPSGLRRLHAGYQQGRSEHQRPQVGFLLPNHFDLPLFTSPHSDVSNLSRAPSDPNHINNSNTRGAASPTMQHPHEPRFNTDLLGQLSSNLSSATNFNHLSDKFTSENDNSDAARHLF